MGSGDLGARLRVGTCAAVVMVCASCASVPSPGDAVLPSQPVPTQGGRDAAAPLPSASGTAGADGDAVTAAEADDSNAAAVARCRTWELARSAVTAGRRRAVRLRQVTADLT